VANAHEFHFNPVSFTSYHTPSHTVIHSDKTPDRFPVHFENFVAGLESSLLRWRVRQDVADNGGGIRFAHWMADHPHNAGKRKREKQAKEGAGHGHDNFIESGDRRQLCTVHIRLTLDNVHRRELRQRNKSTKRERAQRVLHAVDRLFPERFAEPDTEFPEIQSAPPRCQKMAELMDNDQQIKQDEDFEENQNDARDVDEHYKL